jgi:hypothetical protein
MAGASTAKAAHRTAVASADLAFAGRPHPELGQLLERECSPVGDEPRRDDRQLSHGGETIRSLFVLSAHKSFSLQG